MEQVWRLYDVGRARNTVRLPCLLNALHSSKESIFLLPALEEHDIPTLMMVGNKELIYYYTVDAIFFAWVTFFFLFFFQVLI